jgi:hypothetical protein
MVEVLSIFLSGIAQVAFAIELAFIQNALKSKTGPRGTVNALSGFHAIDGPQFSTTGHDSMHLYYSAKHAGGRS